ncbi:phage major capsid protein [Aureimonas ureilytica]|uniref:phage major capsid protein n=1 Tax=Aureimonas ureilytica TaxID=401562 RepID=UPI000AA420AB|nr:phage major capsid protein [Aureimonas ureilytica]
MRIPLFAAVLMAVALTTFGLFGPDAAHAATLPALSVASHLDLTHVLSAGVMALGAVHDPLAFERGRKNSGGSGGGGDGELVGLSQKLGAITDTVKNFAEEVKGRLEKGDSLSTALKEQIDEALLGMNEMKSRVAELEQKGAREPGEGEVERKSLGQLVIDDEAFKTGGMTSSSRKALRVQMSRKDITSGNGTVGTVRSPGNSLVPADRQGSIVAPPQRRMRIRDLLMPGETGAASIEYPVETGFTNNAAMVAEGATKPKSDITFELKTANVRTLAHIFKASRQIMDDAPALRSYIDGRATYGLEFKEELQFLFGDGTGQNLFGLVPQATAFAVPTGMAAVASPTAIDRLRIAILQVILAEYPASAYVLNPIDWATIEMLKDAGGNYIISNPQDGTSPTLWNLPVVATPAMTQNRFLTGAFDMAAQIFDRMEIEVLLSTENSDDFERNMMTIRAEERVALATYRPEAFVQGQVNPS